jgi:hypothetical protein
VGPGGEPHAAGDELVWVWTAQALNQALAQAGVAYAWYMHPAAEHLTFAVLDDWGKEAAYTKELRLVRNPPRVRYRTDLSLGNAGLGIVHDRAYWVSSRAGARGSSTSTSRPTPAAARRPSSSRSRGPASTQCRGCRSRAW